MSLSLSRWPGYFGRDQGKPELDEALCASYLEAAETSKAEIPASLSFDEVIKNHNLSPCSLNDFMDYLMYVEYNAEYLQFFLWYSGYVERWSKLSQEERSLSPAWRSAEEDSIKPKHTRSKSFTAKTERLHHILNILERNPNINNIPQITSSKTLQSNKPGSKNFSWPSRALSEEIERWEVELEKNKKASNPPVQPFREELFRIMQQYITAKSPRQLDLTQQTRAACTEAVRQTTHPSALLPVFAATEAFLRGHSHPRFIRWSVSNCNYPRLVIIRGIGATLAILGFVGDIVLILSSINPWVRMLLAPFWILGFSFLIASHYGVCIILQWAYKRDLRPWEQYANEGTGARSEAPGIRRKQDKTKSHKYKTSDTGPSRASGDDIHPLRMHRLNSLSETDAFETESWYLNYCGKSIWKRIFEVSTTTENRPLRAMRDRIVFKALIWASIIAVVLAISSVFIPSPGVF